MTNSKILPQIKKIDFVIIINLALLALALYLVNYTNIDVEIQNHLFDFEHKTWLIDKSEPIGKFFFYKLPKIILGVAIIFSLFAAFFSKDRQKFLLIFLGLSLIPLIAGNIKKFTNVYCPTQLEIYGGDKPYVRIFEKYPENFIAEKAGKCFPAGHAITGFALLILVFVLQKKMHKFLAFFAIIIFGWILGFYQMAKGVHFFGDTLVAMLVCFLLAALIARIYELRVAKTLPKT